MGIRCNLHNSIILFILSVYLSSSSHNIHEYHEYLDYFWALYDSLSAKGTVVAVGDFNGDLGNSLGNRETVNLNQRGVKLAEFAIYFSLCSRNLLSICEGPLETYFLIVQDTSQPLITFLPNCLYHSIENTPDHVPVKLQIEFSTDTHTNKINSFNSYSRPKLKVNWSKFSKEEIERTYTTPILSDLENMTIVEPDNFTNSTENLTKILNNIHISL